MVAKRSSWAMRPSPEITIMLTIYYYIDQTISLTCILLPFTSYSPFPLSCTLLGYSYRYFVYTIRSIVVERLPILIGISLLIVHLDFPAIKGVLRLMLPLKDPFMSRSARFVVIDLRFIILINVRLSSYEIHVACFQIILDDLLLSTLQCEYRVILTAIFTLTDLNKDILKRFIHRRKIYIISVCCYKCSMFFAVQCRRLLLILWDHIINFL